MVTEKSGCKWLKKESGRKGRQEMYTAQWRTKDDPGVERKEWPVVDMCSGQALR